MFMVIMSAVFVLASMILFIRSLPELGSVKTFECGMNRMVCKGLYFSLRFFILSLLFLLMDLELVLLIFSPMLIPSSSVFLLEFSLILWVFVLGTIWEWWIGSIDWSL